MDANKQYAYNDAAGEMWREIRHNYTFQCEKFEEYVRSRYGEGIGCVQKLVRAKQEKESASPRKGVFSEVFSISFIVEEMLGGAKPFLLLFLFSYFLATPYFIC